MKLKVIVLAVVIGLIALVITLICIKSSNLKEDTNDEIVQVNGENEGNYYTYFSDYEELKDDTEFDICYYGGLYWVDGVKQYSPSLTFPSTYDNNDIIGIVENSFEDNDKLEEVVLPYGYFVNQCAFTNSSVTSLIVSDYCELYISSFQDCAQLEKVVYTGISEDLNANVFDGCTSLKDVQLSEGITYIEYHAFANCTSLTEIQLPASLEGIHEDAFENTPLQKIIGYSNSVAESFAKEHNIMFESLD
jgi:hypothetical protein